MKARFLTVLKKRYTEEVDYNFPNFPEEKKLYGNMNWLSEENKPSEEQINKWIIEDDFETAMNLVREKRNKLLSETDWMFRSDMNPSDELKKYCQDLRDLTDNISPELNDNGDLIENFDWPIKP